jgi:hypothetical protein
MNRRTILRASQHSNFAAREMLALVFASEILDPAPEFWLAMAWVSDVVLFDSLHGEFDALIQSHGRRRVYISDVLTELARRGALVNVVTRPDPNNEKFLEVLRRKTALAHVEGRFRLGLSEAIHQKNLVGNDWFTDGSMNLTVNGLDHNVENLTIDFDPEKTAETRTNIRQTWNGILGPIDDCG